MGNSATKEQRTSNSHSSPTSPTQATFLDQRQSHENAESSSDGRRNRSDLYMALGNPGEEERAIRGTDWRKETKQEREARKLEKERANREKERARSMREEHVDGGYLVTQGTYTGTEDYGKHIVRQLMIERRLAPFWRGLNEFRESWTEHQLVAAARGLPIPAPDEIPPEEEEERSEIAPKPKTKPAPAQIETLTLPIDSRSQSQSSEASSNPSSAIQPAFPPVSSVPSSLGSALAKGRSKTLATLTSSSKIQPAEIRPREIRLPRDPHVNGQRLEAHLYKDATECPICFLYYPPYLNKTRCCDQEMCSECFVQIKRPDPHPPEHVDPSLPPPAPAEIEGREGELVSEPATCPFCKVPQFGITYEPPSFRKGLVYANHASGHLLNRSVSGMSSSSSLASAGENGGGSSPTVGMRRRTISVSATSPAVITTDQIRPDWSDKLAAARAHAARRSAAATALHTAAYMMGNRGHDDARGFAGFSRRGLLRRTSGNEHPTYGGPSTQMSMLSLMSERNAQRANADESGAPAGAHGSSRRGRLEDLEDIMMMEAIRLSLASEEERRKREDKIAKKEAKKKEKEAKKKEKAAKKAGSYPGSANASTSALQIPSQSSAKGKEVQPETEQYPDDAPADFTLPTMSPQSHLQRARAHIQGEGSPSQPSGPYNPAPFRPSHLRTQSNVSSSASSMEGVSAPGSLLQDPREPGSSLDVSPAGSRINIPGTGPTQEPYVSGTPPGGGAGSEPMFNFRSLAAMVGDDDHVNKDKAGLHTDEGPKAAKPLQHDTYSGAMERSQEDLRLQLSGEDHQAVKTPNKYETVLSAPGDAVS